MHSFARHRHSRSGEAPTKDTKGLVLNGGWRYDLMGWFIDTFVFRGQWRELRQRTANLAQLHPGEQVLDVGCGTGTLAIEVARQVGRAGCVAGVDPGIQQIARACAKAARRHVPIDFQICIIEQLPFPDQTFDVVLSTLMMHHLPTPLKRQGLAEIARVLKPGGRLNASKMIMRPERVTEEHLAPSLEQRDCRYGEGPLRESYPASENAAPRRCGAIQKCCGDDYESQPVARRARAIRCGWHQDHKQECTPDTTGPSTH